MLRCKNGYNTIQYFDELCTLLRWNLPAWKQDAIKAIVVEMGRGILANSGGWAHSKVLVILQDDIDIRNYWSIQEKIFAPRGSRTIRFPDREDFLFTDFHLEKNLWLKIDFSNPRMDFIDTINAAEENSERIKSVFRIDLNSSVESFIIVPGAMGFNVYGSLENREKNDQWLQTLPKAIEVTIRSKKELLGVSMYVKYSSVEFS